MYFTLISLRKVQWSVFEFDSRFTYLDGNLFEQSEAINNASRCTSIQIRRLHTYYTPITALNNLSKKSTHEIIKCPTHNEFSLHWRAGFFVKVEQRTFVWRVKFLGIFFIFLADISMFNLLVDRSTGHLSQAIWVQAYCLNSSVVRGGKLPQ